MALIYCSKCKHEISNLAKCCVYCGAAIPGDKATETHDTTNAPVQSKGGIEKIDVNVCSKWQLAYLPGMNEEKAEIAINMREIKGGFDSVQNFITLAGIESRYVNEMNRFAKIGPKASHQEVKSSPTKAQKQKISEQNHQASQKQKNTPEQNRVTPQKKQTQSAADQKISLIDINICSELDLCSLPGMDAGKAHKAILVRNRDGAFRDFYDFIEKLNIQPHLAMQIEPYVSVSPISAKSENDEKKVRVVDL